MYATQNEDDPSEALVIQELTNVKPSIVDKPEFNEVFDGRFSEVVFEFDVEVDVKKLIDELEDLEREDVELDSSARAEWCELTIKGLQLTVRMEPSELKVVSRRGKSPNELIEGFFAIQKMIAGTVVAPALKA